jgi:hypothetical protein
MVETKKTSEDIHDELDSITLRLLDLSQELIHAKLRLEEVTKQVCTSYFSLILDPLLPPCHLVSLSLTAPPPHVTFYKIKQLFQRLLYCNSVQK